MAEFLSLKVSQFPLNAYSMCACACLNMFHVPVGFLLTIGCTSYTYYGAMDGAFSDGQNCTAQNDGTTGRKTENIYFFV